MGPSPLYSPFSVISVCSEVSRLWFTLSPSLQHTQRHKTTRPRAEPPKTMSQNGSSQMWFLSRWWTGKYPNEDIDIAWYFTSIHGWAREGDRCSFTAVSIGQLSSSTSWVKWHTHSILFQWLCLRIWLNPISRLLKHVICWQERGWIYFLVWGPERRCRERPEGKTGGSCELSSGAYKPGFHTFPSSDIETEWWEPFSSLLMAEFNRYIQFFNSAFLI